MTAIEANFDGIIGPTHNYGGLSFGNVASARNKGAVSSPKGAVLEGLQKAKQLADAGLIQGVLPPQERPDIGFLRSVGFSGNDKSIIAAAARIAPELLRNAYSASPMWAANAATVSPSADTTDGRVHMTPANLSTTLHRSLEGGATHTALRRVFPEPLFTVHKPLPSHPNFADEGAANHVRLCAEHGQPGVEVFVFGREAGEEWRGQFPARQTRQAFEAIVRSHGLDPKRCVFIRQGQNAINAGAFHNDVVCVGALSTLFFHELAFDEKEEALAEIRKAAQGLFEPQFVEVLQSDVTIEDAISSYLFNSLLLALPGDDRLLLNAPVEVKETPSTYAYCQRLTSGNGPIGGVKYVDIRQSMRNGGGPACLRLRVVLTPAELAAVNRACLLTKESYETLCTWAEKHYRDALSADDLADPALLDESRAALDALTGILQLGSDFYPFQRA